MKFQNILIAVAGIATQVLATTWDEADSKATTFMGDLSEAEKIDIVTGYMNMQGTCVGNIKPNPRKSFKGLCLQDGPAGVRFNGGTSTTWQAGINNAATFNKELLYQIGKDQGAEFKAKGINIALAPSMNILRAPASGRVWENYGEDPFLSGKCAALITKGMQDSGVIVSAKHYVANDIEHNREASSSNMDDQTLMEIHVEPFYRAVTEGDAGSVMASYNAVNNVYVVQNKKVLTEILKEQIGFKGFIVSDWWAIHDLEGSFNAGMDMNMPGGKYWGPDYINDSFWDQHIQECIDSGIFPQERLDDAALRIIRTLFKAGQMEGYPKVDLYVDTLTKENIALNRKIGADSNVLLKNDDEILPIKGVKKIAVIGKDAMPAVFCDDMKCANGTLALGWGSGTTDFKYVIDPLSGVTERAEQDGIEVVSYGEDDAEGGAAVAAEADLAIVFVQADSGEEYIVVEGNAGDRVDLDLWHGGNELIDAVAAVNKNTIVVIHAPGPVNVPFIDNVKGIIFAGMPGQESGHAIADVLFGDVNPSGHLPYTWAPREDYPTDVKYEPEYPDGGEKMTVYDYNEGIFVGYRWFDKQGIVPTFPFGFGLSYTTFEYSDLEGDMEDDGLYVYLNVKNTGKVAGAAVPMVFLTFPESVKDYPVRLFKGFDKVWLEPGESKEVTIFIDDHDLSYYNVEKKEFIRPEDGEFTIHVGSNALDLPLSVTLLANGDDYDEEVLEDSNCDESDVEEIEDDLQNDEDSAEDSEDDVLSKRSYKLY